MSSGRRSQRTPTSRKGREAGPRSAAARRTTGLHDSGGPPPTDTGTARGPPAGAAGPRNWQGCWQRIPAGGATPRLLQALGTRQRGWWATPTGDDPARRRDRYSCSSCCHFQDCRGSTQYPPGRGGPPAPMGRGAPLLGMMGLPPGMRPPMGPPVGSPPGRGPPMGMPPPKLWPPHRECAHPALASSWPPRLCLCPRRLTVVLLSPCGP